MKKGQGHADALGYIPVGFGGLMLKSASGNSSGSILVATSDEQVEAKIRWIVILKVKEKITYRHIYNLY